MNSCTLTRVPFILLALTIVTVTNASSGDSKKADGSDDSSTGSVVYMTESQEKESEKYMISKRHLYKRRLYFDPMSPGERLLDRYHRTSKRRDSPVLLRLLEEI